MVQIQVMNLTMKLKLNNKHVLKKELRTSYPSKLGREEKQSDLHAIWMTIYATRSEITREEDEVNMVEFNSCDSATCEEA